MKPARLYRSEHEYHVGWADDDYFYVPDWLGHWDLPPDLTDGGANPDGPFRLEDVLKEGRWLVFPQCGGEYPLNDFEELQRSMLLEGVAGPNLPASMRDQGLCGQMRSDPHTLESIRALRAKALNPAEAEQTLAHRQRRYRNLEAVLHHIAQYYDEGFPREESIGDEQARWLRELEDAAEDWRCVNSIGFVGTPLGLTREQSGALGYFLLRPCEKSADQMSRCAIHLTDDEASNSAVHAAAQQTGIDLAIHPAKSPFKFCFRGDTAAAAMNILVHPARTVAERNREIVSLARLFIAAPGTGVEPGEEESDQVWDAIRYARATDKPTIVIWPNGDPSAYNLWPLERPTVCSDWMVQPRSVVVAQVRVGGNRIIYARVAGNGRQTP